MRRLNWLNIFLVLFLLACGVVVFFAFRKPPAEVTQQINHSKQQSSSSKPTPPKAAPAPVPSPPVVTTPTPTPSATPKLANTGPGNVIELAAMVSVVGAFSSSVFLSRRRAS